MKPVLILHALLLAACCTQPVQLPEEDKLPDASIRLGPAGITGLEGQLPFTLPAMERAFEGFEVVSVADPDLPAFHIRETGSRDAIFIVTPDWTRGFTGSITALVPSQSGPFRVEAGVTTYGQLPADFIQNCTVQPGSRDGPVFCEAPLPAGRLTLDFPASRADPVLEEIAYYSAARDR